MIFSRININNFRNLQQIELSPHPGFNYIVGANGSGKTSLLEAIFYLGHGRSFKSSVSNRIIQYEQPHLLLYGKINEKEHNWSVGLQKFRSGESKMRINGEDGNKIADLARLLPMQVISPEGLSLLNGGPLFRRAFIDWGLFHHHSAFFDNWRRLSRALKQRNAALTQVSNYSQLQAWDNEIAPLAEQISQWRNDYVIAISPEIQRCCKLFLPEIEIQISFYYGWDKERSYAELLAENFSRDRSLGYTFSGPQKADLRLKVNGMPVNDILSRGQLKLLMCALRLAQGEFLMQQKSRHCLFLLDDFASELDQDKRQRLAERLQTIGAQVFVTSIMAEQLGKLRDISHRLYEVKNGLLTENETTL